jgi:lysophospholipase L1-like esterase
VSEGGRRIRVAALGDSITAGTPGWDPDPAVRAKLESPDPHSQWTFWAQHRDTTVVFVNHGVNRERTDQIAARLDAALDGAEGIVIQGGINDVVQGRSADLAAEDIETMIRRARDRVEHVLVTNLLPWNNGDERAGETILGLNDAIARIATEQEIEMLPFYATLEDPAAPGRMAQDWTVEGNHPSIDGHRRLGELAWRAGALAGESV